jgi:hypothetical protein
VVVVAAAQRIQRTCGDNTAWPQSNIDHFVLAKLEEKKLAPVKDADPINSDSPPEL